MACRVAMQAALPQLSNIAQHHEDPNMARKAQELEEELMTLMSV